MAYGTYIGDGDSSSFKNVKESDPYNSRVTVRKEECIGHVQKRLKKRLMKKSGGAVHLSQSKADRTSHLYALVIVQHRGQSAPEFHNGLQVLLDHTKENHEIIRGVTTSKNLRCLRSTALFHLPPLGNPT